MRRIFLIYFLMMFFAATVMAGVTDLPQETLDPSQAFVNGAIVVKGEGAAPDKPLSPAQKRILALRAAKVVALREVAEIIDGVSVSGETTVYNAATESDVVRTTVHGLIKGAQVIKEIYDPLSGMAVVYVSVPMSGLNGVVGSLLPKLLPTVPALPMFAPVSPVQANYDGLIVDVSAAGFKPALINRIVTGGGEVIYDPAKVAQSILVQKGAAEYTNDLGKAKALLGQRGSSNPLVVRAEGAVKGTDALLGADDANAVFSSNQSTNYLESAKVVFVLK